MLLIHSQFVYFFRQVDGAKSISFSRAKTRSLLTGLFDFLITFFPPYLYLFFVLFPFSGCLKSLMNVSWCVRRGGGGARKKFGGGRKKIKNKTKRKYRRTVCQKKAGRQNLGDVPGRWYSSVVADEKSQKEF